MAPRRRTRRARRGGLGDRARARRRRSRRGGEGRRSSGRSRRGARARRRRGATRSARAAPWRADGSAPGFSSTARSCSARDCNHAVAVGVGRAEDVHLVDPGVEIAVAACEERFVFGRGERAVVAEALVDPFEERDAPRGLARRRGGRRPGISTSRSPSSASFTPRASREPRGGGRTDGTVAAPPSGGGCRPRRSRSLREDHRQRDHAVEPEDDEDVQAGMWRRRLKRIHGEVVRMSVSQRIRCAHGGQSVELHAPRAGVCSRVSASACAIRGASTSTIREGRARAPRR